MHKPQSSKVYTVWLIYDFSIAQIFREIDFRDSWSAKFATLTQLVVPNSDFYEFLHFLKADIYQINKIQSPQNGKNGDFGTST